MIVLKGRFKSIIPTIILWYVLNVAWSLYTLGHADITKFTNWSAVQAALNLPGPLASSSTPFWIDIIFVFLCIAIYIWLSKRSAEKQQQGFVYQAFSSFVASYSNRKNYGAVREKVTWKEIRQENNIKVPLLLYYVGYFLILYVSTLFVTLFLVSMFGSFIPTLPDNWQTIFYLLALLIILLVPLVGSLCTVIFEHRDNKEDVRCKKEQGKLHQVVKATKIPPFPSDTITKDDIERYLKQSIFSFCLKSSVIWASSMFACLFILLLILLIIAAIQVNGFPITWDGETFYILGWVFGTMLAISLIAGIVGIMLEYKDSKQGAARAKEELPKVERTALTVTSQEIENHLGQSVVSYWLKGFLIHVSLSFLGFGLFEVLIAGCALIGNAFTIHDVTITRIVIFLGITLVLAVLMAWLVVDEEYKDEVRLATRKKEDEQKRIAKEKEV